jgi:hypothetical protein
MATPTPQGISALLRKAGFEKAVITNNSRYVKENTEGFRVHKLAGDVIVNHWPASVPLTARTTASAQAERAHEREMLQRYAEVIRAAGWRVKESALRNLIVDAHPDPALLLAAKDGERQ